MPWKIQPIDYPVESIRNESNKSPASKSRLKRLFDLQFASVLRISEKFEPHSGTDFEANSFSLDDVVKNFIEDNNERTFVTKSGRSRCNCFNSNGYSSDEEFENFLSLGENLPNASLADSCERLKNIASCASVTERNLLAETSKIVETNTNLRRKADLRIAIVEGLRALDYDASICKSRCEKSFCPGEYEFIDVILEEDRLLIDVDFRVEFEIARPTSMYRSILQSLPFIFVGQPDRLDQIVKIVSEAAKQSLKKKGMHVPPWRKAEYMRAKWLSSSSRSAIHNVVIEPIPNPWQPPEVKSRRGGSSGRRIVSGLAALFEEKT